MNRYLLVVTPGIEKLLYKEVQTLVPRLQTLGKPDGFVKGGIELDCSNCIKTLIQSDRSRSKRYCKKIASCGLIPNEYITFRICSAETRLLLGF